MLKPLTIVAGLFALAAALFWFLSAIEKIPAPETYWDKMPEDAPFIVSMRRVAKLNAIAATCSGLAALLAAASAFMAP